MRINCIFRHSRFLPLRLFSLFTNCKVYRCVFHNYRRKSRRLPPLSHYLKIHHAGVNLGPGRCRPAIKPTWTSRGDVQRPQRASPAPLCSGERGCGERGGGARSPDSRRIVCMRVSERGVSAANTCHYSGGTL